MNFVRALSTAGLFLLSLNVACVSEKVPDVKLKMSGNLYQLSQIAQDKRQPILLFFSAEHCPYCNIVEEEFLKPMLRSGDYVDKVLIRKTDIDDFEQHPGFDRKLISGSELAVQRHVFVTPTLLFLDPQGEEIVERMVGITTVDFYGGYLDDAIDKAHLLTQKANTRH